MYRVMIVDDEEPVLDSFAFILEKDVKDFVLCGKARSGIEAIGLVPELMPDLIFMDIQMPGMDGLETITQIRKQYPRIVFILATAFERFDIAKKAIPLGIFSYLVKPVSRKMLVSELNKVKQHLDEVKERNTKNLEEVKYFNKTREEEKKRFLMSLVWKSPEKHEWEAFGHLFNIECDFGLIVIAELESRLADDIRKEVFTRLTEQFLYKQNCFSISVSGRLMLFFPLEGNDFNVDDAVRSAAEGLKKYKFRFGTGSIQHYSELNKSYLEANRVFGQQDRNSSIHSEERKIIRDLVQRFLTGYWDDAVAAFDDYWVNIFNINEFNIAKGKMIVFLTLLINEINEDFLVSQGFNVNPAEEIMPMLTIDEWRLWIVPILDFLKTILKKNREGLYPKALSGALNYIHSNFSKPLQLSELADMCRISSGYLSRLFTEHLGMSFVDYLNRFRIKQAVALLSEENATIKEISYRVGYSDPNYFSRIFKKYMNTSPSDISGRRLTSEM